MAQLPQFQSDMQPLQLMQSRWATILNPIINNPVTDPTILTGIALQAGDNVINHRLGKLPQGWLISDLNAAAVIYRNAPFNDRTLTLNSSVAAVINLVVY